MTQIKLDTINYIKENIWHLKGCDPNNLIPLLFNTFTGENLYTEGVKILNDVNYFEITNGCEQLKNWQIDLIVKTINGIYKEEF